MSFAPLIVLLEQAVDDRTYEQRNGIADGPLRSRVSTSTTYLNPDRAICTSYGFPNIEVDADVKQHLMQGGMDEALATHFAHNFTRDPLLAFEEDLEAADVTKRQLSDGLTSNVYQLVRFKMPSGEDSGFLVEFRPMEAQVSHNVAFGVFAVLLAKMILSLRPNFYIPLQNVEENMKAASQVDAASQGRFWFRMGNWNRVPQPLETTTDSRTIQCVTADAIINGHRTSAREAGFPGLIPMIKDWMNDTNVLDTQLRSKVDECLDIVSRRAAGTLPTDARWIRELVSKHPSYQQDSAVPEDIVFDIIEQCLARTEAT